eukprot:TRINITY_DN8162_c0_g1::TRINITY_DN8162_c0_g1_i1::g.7194::m.7194 TRINITY_DN8162_c0_g1::TRINITY_DN8162_c0_g1_i1::g.7194  ORF type:complete len:491 (+),score=41.90,sp/Q55GC7/SGMD_DICDI/32.68/8e-49,Metallophos/PF00149.23/1.6e-07 TRINITY_DN8162_c0_g1_i1:36-1475(+)
MGRGVSLSVLLCLTICFVAYAEIQFYHVSDIHYDPWYDQNLQNDTTCRPAKPPTRLRGGNISLRSLKTVLPDADNPYLEYGKVGCDTPPILMESTMKAMQSLNARPHFILLTGDLAAHKLSSWGPDYILQAVSQTLSYFRNAFPDAVLIPTIGNNDLNPHYRISCNDEWLGGLLEIFRQYLPEGTLRDNESISAFLSGGYYTVSPVAGLRVIILNTIYYSTSADPIQTGSDPCGQFDWLSRQLEQAAEKGEKVYLASHIPPGVSIKRETLDYEILWQDKFISKYEEILHKHSDIIVMNFFGHTHRDEFRVMSSTHKKGEEDVVEVSYPGYSKTKTPVHFPFLVAPAVTPNRFNNPGFKLILTSEKSFTILDQTTAIALFHPCEPPASAEKEQYRIETAALPWIVQRSWKEMYPQFGKEPINGTTLQLFAQDLAADPEAFHLWAWRWNTQFGLDYMTPDLYHELLCALTFIDSKSYHACL